MSDKKSFRCPFEVQGIRERAIMEVVLSENQEERFAVLCGVLEEFHLKTKWMAIRLVLPESLLTHKTFDALRRALIPYQAEVIAADLDDALYPYLPHQASDRQLWKKSNMKLRLFDEEPALRLRKEFGAREPSTLGELAVWIGRMHLKRKGRPLILYKRKLWPRGQMRMELGLAALRIYGESGEILKANFNIVLCPLYPKETGRHSERVEIVLTRHSDIVRLDAGVRQRIRRQANESYVTHGIIVENVEKTQQPPGLWVPRREPQEKW